MQRTHDIGVPGDFRRCIRIKHKRLGGQMQNHVGLSLRNGLVQRLRIADVSAQILQA